jgi:xylitol oxidase
VNEVNWAGNLRYRAAALHRPTKLEEVQDIIARASSIRVLGSRHSFNDIADAAELITLDALPPNVVIDHEAGTVSFSAGLRYGELAERLNQEGAALANLGSLPHISVAGAVATATHGSGHAIGNLATAVRKLEIITSSGEVVEVRRGDAEFDGVVVGLGALGAVTRVTLDVERSYQVRQRVFDNLAWESLLANFDAITSAGYSVSLFTQWDKAIDQVWVKSRGDDPETLEGDLFGALPATEDRHPIVGLDPVNCTPQLGVSGLWSDRLPHFRMGFMPSSGDELQSEYLVPRRFATEAVEALRRLSRVVAPVLQVSEIRTVAGDELWMSPEYGRDTMAIHFTWVSDEDAVARALRDVEKGLAPFGARPHWGKVFLSEAGDIAELYDRLPDFIDLMERWDPRAAFRNDWLERYIVGRR